MAALPGDGAKPLRKIVRFRITQRGTMLSAMRHLKSILTFCLCMAVLVASVTSVVARGHVAAGQLVQICADGQPISAVVYANGNAVDASQYCVEYQTVAGDLPPATPEVGLPNGRWTRIDLPLLVLKVERHTIKTVARGPPALI